LGERRPAGEHRDQQTTRRRELGKTSLHRRLLTFVIACSPRLRPGKLCPFRYRGGVRSACRTGRPASSILLKSLSHVSMSYANREALGLWNRDNAIP
jgi:hypothetical protein